MSWAEQTIKEYFEKKNVRFLQRTLLIFAFIFFPIAQLKGQHKPLADLKIAAEKGDPVAQTELAERSNSDEALVLLRKAANQNYAPAQGKLGWRLWMHSQMSIGKTRAEREVLGKEALK